MYIPFLSFLFVFVIYDIRNNLYFSSVEISDC